MPRTPARATPRPLFDLLSDALIALIEPSAPGRSGGVRPEPVRRDRYALFDVPTYQRRRLAIDGIDGETATADPGRVSGPGPGREPR